MNQRIVLPFIAAIGTVALGFVVAKVSPAEQSAQAPRKAATPPALLATKTTDSVVDAANAFLATLSPQQKATAQIELKSRLAAKWSNFPVSFVPRNGVFFRDLTAEQVAAAMKVARLALSEEGYKRFQEIRAADDVLDKADNGPGGGGGPGGRGSFGGPGGPGGFGGPDDGGPGDFGGPGDGGPDGGFGGPPGPPPGGFGGGPGGFGGPGGQGGRGGGRFGGPGGQGNEYGAGNYMIAFLGQPSKTTPWLLQLGGHHLAFNIYYKGKVGASTPYFIGVEPTSWKGADGQTHAPLAPMSDAMYGLVNSLTSEQLKQARLDARFSDVYVGPGRDGQFPAREGVAVSELAPASKEFVKQAIAAWTGDSAQAAKYRKLYYAELNQTKVAYSGTKTLKNEGDYVRIDGPHVWIELACQGGIVFHNQIHYHTIWRDRLTDYGAEFSY